VFGTRTEPGRSWGGDFRALWFGQTVSSVGSQLSLVAIPLIAALTLHAGPLEMAILGGLESAPFVILSLPAGVVADRYDRRRLMIACDLLRALVMGAIPVIFVSGNGSFLWLCLAGAVVGSLSALFTVAQQAYVPEVVARDRLVAANQRLEISEAAARVAGPGIASILFQIGGGLLAIAIDAVSYLASGVAIARARRTMTTGHTPVARPPTTAIAAGVRFVWHDRVLRALMISTATFNLATGMLLAQLVLFATGSVGVDAAGFGLFMAIGNVGFIVGAAAVGRLESRLGTGRVLLVAAVLGSLALWLIALAGFVGGFPLLVAGRFVGAFSAPTFNVVLVTVRQARSSESLRARVIAIFRTIDWGTAPLGAALSGIVGLAFGVPAVMVCAAAVGSFSLVCLLGPEIRSSRLGEDNTAVTATRMAMPAEAA
jgi:MFS family permease